MSILRNTPTNWPTSFPNPFSYEDALFYNQHGYVVLRDVLSQYAVETLYDHAMIMLEDAADFESTLWEAMHPKVVRSIFDMHNLNERIRQFVTSSFMQRYSRYILGSECAIHQCHVNYKQARVGGEYDWHSDYTFWHYDDKMPQPRAISTAIPLTASVNYQGPLQVIPGSHLWWYPRDWSKRPPADGPDVIRHDATLSDEYEMGLYRKHEIDEMIRKTSLGVQTVRLHPGDIFIMDANLAHASGPNESDVDRVWLFTIYNSIENKPGRGTRPNYISDLEGQRG